MTNPLLDIRAAARPDASSPAIIQSSIHKMLTAGRPPTDAAIAGLLTPDAIGVAFDVLKPGGLVDIIGFSLQGLLAFRLARHFGAIGINGGGFDFPDLKRLRSPEGRLAQAACGLLGWRGANVEERRILIVRRLLLMRAHRHER